MTPATFFESLYGDIPAGMHLVVFGLDFRTTPPRRVVRWCADIGAADAAVGFLAGAGYDVYFGVCLQDRDAALAHAQAEETKKAAAENRPVARISLEMTRGFAATATAIPAIWADVDVADPVHKKENLPPTIADADALVARLPLPPTLTVLSGHGIQPLWVFQEPATLTTPEERETAAATARGWQDRLRRVAGERGWDVDATHDLARVLRVPGTFNRKDPARPVEVVVR